MALSELKRSVKALRDTANTRELWHIVPVAAISVFVPVLWYFGAPLPLVGLVAIGALFAIWRCFDPIIYELVVDESGITWGQSGRRKKKELAWSEIRSIRENENEFHMDVGSHFLVTLPSYFLRSEEKKDAFLEIIRQYSPATKIKESHE